MSNERDRAWRRFKNWVNNGRGMGTEERWKPEKNWKMLYVRSEKQARAKQLGFEYPRKSSRQLLDLELSPNE
ncbi:hypothetical protein [Thiofilum flexile]|uniref:hypothetical protein n=1 Tax=Thiofilum flexile TaxID=125627 RepID=UPI000361504D|nr:hypothetical protein [Thiofilum flexile]